MCKINICDTGIGPFLLHLLAASLLLSQCPRRVIAGSESDESSSGENRCLLLPQEKTERRRCGDGYITDRDRCLACGCCFLPDYLPGERYATAVPCYAPITCPC